LNDLTASLDRAKVMGPWFEQNGVYPIFVAWQSGVADTIENIIADLIGSLISGAQDRKTRSLVDTVSDARDYLIEAAAIRLCTIWSQMKQNAVAASSGDGGMVALARCLARLGEDYSNLEVHLVGHSAGAILLGAFLDQLAGNRLTARTVSLYAPACTVAFANSTYLPAAETKVIDPKRVVCDVLSNAKLDDTVGPYGKSLLYLNPARARAVPQDTDPRHGSDLGAQADKEACSHAVPGRLNPDAAFKKVPLKPGRRPGARRERVVEELPAFSIRSVHGCFDNRSTASSSIARIRPVVARQATRASGRSGLLGAVQEALMDAPAARPFDP
jgi:hypothetical protein